MKTSQFIVFLSVVFTVYFAVNYYIYVRGLQAIPQDSQFRIYYKLAFLFLCLSFIAARFIERIFINSFSQFTIWSGNFWFGSILYLFLFILLIDIVRLGNYFFNYFPEFITQNYEKTKLITFFAVTGSTLVILLLSYINAANPEIRELSIKIDKSAGTNKHLTIALASDIHLGSVIGKKDVDFLLEKINEMKPDIVLFAGDVVDEDLAPVIKNNIGSELSKFKARYGVWAITGNHEYIGGADAAVKYIEEHGIKYLRDEAVLIDSCFWLVGREDRDAARFGGKQRKELKELLKPVDFSKPVIVMNHQPFNLEEASGLNVDLHLSGHTHHGQLWPLNFLTKKIYELSWGYKKIANTHFYVSSGFGTWGPPMRSGNRPEIVKINVEFSNH